MKKGIREKVYSKVQGFENQKFIQKSELLYNFKNEQSNPQLRTSTTYVKNVLDNVFPRQESPFKSGLAQSIYSPQKFEYESKSRAVEYALPKKKSEYLSQRRNSDVDFKRSETAIDFPRKTKALNERVSLAEIIRISNHLQDISPNEVPQLSSGYLQELIGLQNNINRILRNTTQKLYK